VTALHALVLAAGTGSRFGGRKLLAPWRGGVLLDGALSAALAAPVASVTVVTGADAEAVGAAAAGRARLVHAADYRDGMAASLKAGLEALPEGAGGVIVFLGDMPLIPPDIAPALAAALDAGAPAAAPFLAGRRGHPVALSAALFPELRSIAGDRGARDVLDALGDRLGRIETDDPGVLIDVDSPADLPA
jgi:molybdenum cofactor cytidylyltransferase